jgi:hypothetical protein
VIGGDFFSRQLFVEEIGSESVEQNDRLSSDKTDVKVGGKLLI